MIKNIYKEYRVPPVEIENDNSQLQMEYYVNLGVALVPMRHLKHRKWTHEQGNATPSFEKNN